jgi:hypothetical protein
MTCISLPYNYLYLYLIASRYPYLTIKKKQNRINRKIRKNHFIECDKNNNSMETSIICYLHESGPSMQVNEVNYMVII